MKKILAIALTLALTITVLAACGSDTKTPSGDTSASASTSVDADSSSGGDADSTSTDVTADSNILVVYFSNTGTTKGIAERISAELDADLVEIVPVDPYTEEDLNYNDTTTRATVEQNDPSVRPEIDGTIENWDEYDVILIGHPIWWTEEPRIMDTFVESYDFTGKIVSTFCTSGSSGMGLSEKNMEDLAGAGDWRPGHRFSGNAAEEDIVAWLETIGLK